MVLAKRQKVIVGNSDSICKIHTATVVVYPSMTVTLATVNLSIYNTYIKEGLSGSYILADFEV